MSSESTAETTDVDETRTRIEALERHISADRPQVSERLTALHGRIDAYEDADSDQEQADVLDKAEAELEQLRAAIETEVEEGKAKAEQLVDDIETRIANLR